MRTRGISLVLVALLLTVGGLLAQEGAGARAEIAAARDAMADRNWPDAARRLEQFITDYQVGERVEEAHILLLRARMGAGDLESALETGRAFVGAFPDSPRARKALFLMGEAFARLRGFEDAARIYREQVDFLSGDLHEKKVAGYYLELARAAYEGVEQPDEFARPQLVKDFQRALAYYQKVRSIRAEGEEADLVDYRIADSWFQIGNRERAITEWENLLEKRPGTEWADDATYFIGLAGFRIGDPGKARTWLRKVRREFGDSKWAPEALIVLGETHQPLATKVEDEWERGLAYWREFVSLYPSHERAEEVAFLIGRAAYNFGRFDTAIAEFGKFLAKFPDGDHSPLAKNFVAWSWFKKANFDRAVAEWKEFLGRWPTHELWTKVQARISEAAFAKGRHHEQRAGEVPEREKAAALDRAEQGYKGFLAEFPVHARAPEAQYRLGLLERARDDHAAAVAAWRIVARKYAGSEWAAQALLEIAGAYEGDLVDLTKAIETYEELVKGYGGTSQGQLAQSRLQQYRQKQLEVVTKRVFTTGEPCRLAVRSRNIEKLRVRAYPLDAEETFRRKLLLGGIEDVVVQVVTPEQDLEVETPGFEKYRLFERELELPGLKGPGAWVVTLEDEELTARTLVVVSDLTIVTKQARGQLLVLAINEGTDRPQPGARVLIAAGGKVLEEGRTGRDGVFTREDKKLGGNVTVFAENGGHVASTGLATPSGTAFGYSTKVYLYTDRPLYRPGHEVKLKGIYRRISSGSYANTKGLEVDVEVHDPRGTVVYKEELTANDYGTFSDGFYLHHTAALGTYRIQARTKDKRDFSGSFEVKEFKKPEFTITARSDRRTYLPGEDVKMDLALRYFFGGPVAETKVRYRVLRGPFAFDPEAFDEFAWFTKDPEREKEREQLQSLGMDHVAEGELTTDADGNAELALTLEDQDRDLRYLVVFEALDLNRQWVRESSSITVARQGFFAIAKTEKKVVRPGEELPVRLTTIDAVHFPLSISGELVVARRVFADGRETESVVSRHPVETGEDGRGSVKVKIDRPGEYRLKLVTKDRAGNTVTGATMITVAGEAEDLGRHARVVAARRIYREGESAEVLVNVPEAPVWTLLTIEGERVLDYQVIRLDQRSSTLSLPLKPSYSPNVFVRIAASGDEKLHEAGDEIFVFKYLAVSVEPEQEEARPGEKVAFTVTTSDQRGQPVAAEVSLALVDGAVLALAPDATPQMKPFFYDQRRQHLVATGSSHSFTYSGHTRATNQDLLWEALRNQDREKFQRATKYVRSGKELLQRGDLESAAIEFRKAVQVMEDHYEARVLLDRTEAEMMVRRLEEQLKKHADDKMVWKEEGEASGWGAKRADGVPNADRSNDAPTTRGRAYRGPGGEVPPGMREPSDPGAPPGVPGDKSPARAGYLRAGKFFDNGGDGDYRGRTENVFDLALGTTLGSRGFFSAGPPVPPTLRKNFADTAAWLPHVVTGRDGKATVTVELPDNLTTWRAVARGVTKSTLVGEAAARVTAKKRVLVRVDTPRFLTQKDVVTITGTVHNSSGEDLDVRLVLKGGLVEGKAIADLRLENGRIHPQDFRLVAPEAGRLTLTAEALTGLESDAAVAVVDVLPLGLRTLVGRSEQVTEEEILTFTLPDRVIPSREALLINVLPRFDETLLESIAYLGTFPYGCLEQTVNRFLPALAVDRGLQRTGSRNAKLRALVKEAVAQGLLALYAFQNDDGSFGWFGGSVRRITADGKAPPQRGDPVMTGLAILAMERAREEHYRISWDHLRKARDAGNRLVKTAGNHAEKAFLLHALALGGAADLEDLNQVYRYRDGLGAHALATLALAMKETRREYNAVGLVSLLKSRAIVRDGRAHWVDDSAPAGANTAETTAWALRALLAVEPDGALAADVARWLVENKKGPAWTSTRDTGAVVMALADHMIKQGAEQADYVLEVWINDAEVPYQKIHVVGGKTADENSRLVRIDTARLRAGKNRIKLVKKGLGECFITMMLNYHVEAEEIEPAGNLLTVARRYLEYVPPAGVKAGEAEIRPGWTIVRPEARPKDDPGTTLDRAVSGEKFRVRVTVTAKEDVAYVIVEDPLPAGVEVVEGHSTGPFDWEERRDEKQVFFVTGLAAGETADLTYLVQAIHPGSFRALPTFAYPMYEPEIWGRSSLARLAVADPISGGGPTETEVITPDEIYALAVRSYQAGHYAETRPGLSRLLEEFKLLDEYQVEVLDMLFRSSLLVNDPRRAVEAYESLMELNPRRGPHDTYERRLLAVAYQEIGEFERALSLFKGITDEYLAREVEVSETYRGIGQTHEALSFATRLANSYPDSNAVVDLTYRNALRYLELKVPEEGAAQRKVIGVETGLLLPEALDAFRAFIAHYPGSPLADEACRMAVTTLNRMEAPDLAVTEAQKFIRRYPNSEHLDDVYWYLTESYFEDSKYDQALATGKKILNGQFRIQSTSRKTGPSPFKPHVNHLFAKIHHLRGELDRAVALYKGVSEQFEDARNAYEFLTRRGLRLPETTECGVGAAPSLSIERKNLTELEVRIYPVDLMLLIAVKKDLRAAGQIDLTGLKARHVEQKQFTAGQDYRWHEDRIVLGAREKGAYLVVARSGDLVETGFVIVSDLEVSVQVVGDRVRVYAESKKTGQPMSQVFVKVSDGREIRAQGYTDARGVFEGRGIKGPIILVAQHEDGHYALIRR